MNRCAGIGALVVAALLSLSAPVYAAGDRYPHATMMGSLAVQPDSDATLTGVQVFLRGGLDREGSAHNGLAALTAEVVARTPVTVAGTSRPLRDAIWSLGANLTTTVEPQDVRFYVEGRPDAAIPALGMLAAALAAPDFSNATLAAAKSALRARISDLDQSPFGVVATMLRGAYYPGSSAGMSPAGSAAIVAGASPADVRAFWEKNYRRGGATLAAAGRIDPPVATAAQAILQRLPAGEVAQVDLRAKALTDPPARIVTHRDVAIPLLGLGFAAPPAGTKDFAPMLVVQAIIAALGRESSITTPPPSLRSINVVYQYTVTPANFIIYANGDAADAAAGAREVFAVTELLATKPLEDAIVRRYRTLAVGNFVGDAMTLEDRAGLVGSFALRGLDPDYPNAILDALSKVTPADIERVAKNYLAKYAVAIILPRAESKQR
ncbi:MAG: insulinase family protein [Candidatus Eremiobacteraeota bacterium]|nr:insulinase family protein [Candidatus Eremiobacteraeota bacterium]MBV8355535.1 insulinase family protein [Candidatus Eremiobacteraeota bacterium]